MYSCAALSFLLIQYVFSLYNDIVIGVGTSHNQNTNLSDYMIANHSYGGKGIGQSSISSSTVITTNSSSGGTGSGVTATVVVNDNPSIYVCGLPKDIEEEDLGERDCKNSIMYYML